MLPALLFCLSLLALGRADPEAFGNGQVTFSGSLNQCASISASFNGFAGLAFPATLFAVPPVSDPLLHLPSPIARTGAATAPDTSNALLKVDVAAENSAVSFNLAIAAGTTVEWILLGADGKGQFAGAQASIGPGSTACMAGTAVTSLPPPPAPIAPAASISSASPQSSTAAVPLFSSLTVAAANASSAFPSQSSSVSRTSAVTLANSTASAGARNDVQPVVTSVSIVIASQTADGAANNAAAEASPTSAPPAESDHKTTIIVISALGGAAALIAATVVIIRTCVARRRRSRAEADDWANTFFVKVDPFDPNSGLPKRPDSREMAAAAM